MDTSLLQLERELRSLSPASPGDDLMRKVSLCPEVEAACCPAAVVAAESGRGLRAIRGRRPAGVVRFGPFPWRVVTPAAAAAVVVAVIGQTTPRVPRQSFAGAAPEPDHPAVQPASPASADSARFARRMVPAGFEREVQSFQDHGFSWTGGSSPLHQFSMRALDHHFFESADRSGSVRLSIPRVEQASVPLTFY